jgi:hypothetical protein
MIVQNGNEADKDFGDGQFSAVTNNLETRQTTKQWQSFPAT